MCHIIINGSRCDGIGRGRPNIDLDHLSNRGWRWRMIRWRQSISIVQSVHVFLTTVTFGNADRRLILDVQVRSAVEISVQVGTIAQATEEAHPGVRLQIRKSYKYLYFDQIFFQNGRDFTREILERYVTSSYVSQELYLHQFGSFLLFIIGNNCKFTRESFCLRRWNNQTFRDFQK